MTEDTFVRRHRHSWERLEAMVRSMASRGGTRMVSAGDVVDLAEFDREYRRVCRHLALARQRLYGTDLVSYLNDLALRANQRFYGQRRRYLPAVGRFFLGGFPALVRAHAGAIGVSAALFALPALTMIVAMRFEPDLIHAVMDTDQIRMLEEMYEPGAGYRSHERAAESDVAMFGYYIANNVGIGFRTFAGGVVFGVGSVLIVALNGVYFGAAAAHLHRMGYGETFYPFVVGHSAPELIALVLAGGAGLALGWSVIAPGRLSRLESLRRGASRSVAIASGAAGMLFLAACIEAFWSARAGVSDSWKLGVGAVLWVLVLAYFVFVGNDDAA